MKLLFLGAAECAGPVFVIGLAVLIHCSLNRPSLTLSTSRIFLMASGNPASSSTEEFFDVNVLKEIAKKDLVDALNSARLYRLG